MNEALLRVPGLVCVGGDVLSRIIRGAKTPLWHRTQPLHALVPERGSLPTHMIRDSHFSK